MAVRPPLSPLSTSLYSGPPLFNTADPYSEREVWGAIENLEVGATSTDDEPPCRDLFNVIDLASSIDSEAILGAADGIPRPIDYASAPILAGADASSNIRGAPLALSESATVYRGLADDGENDYDLRRFLAFANRARASGSGLPVKLERLRRAADSPTFSDGGAVMSSVAEFFRKDRFVDRAVVARVEEAEKDIFRPGTPGYDRNYGIPLSAEEKVLVDSLRLLCEYKACGRRRLESTSTQGLAPQRLAENKKAPEMPLRHQLLLYLCNADIHKECAETGLRFPKPDPLYLEECFTFRGEVVTSEVGELLRRSLAVRQRADPPPAPPQDEPENEADISTTAPA